jgi:hypothetical protein
MQRRISSKGFNVPASQHTEVERMKHETVFIPSNTIPTWGSYITADIKEKNVLITTHAGRHATHSAWSCGL